MTKPQKNWLEWAVFGLGGLLVLGIVSYLAWSAWTAGDEPASIEVTLGVAEPRENHFALPVQVFNRGDKPAAEVRIEVVLTTQDGQRERSEFSMAFLPQHASREGWVTFVSDPSAAVQISARPLGYEAP